MRKVSNWKPIPGNFRKHKQLIADAAMASIRVRSRNRIGEPFGYQGIG
jgi:hypothetical protein